MARPFALRSTSILVVLSLGLVVPSLGFLAVACTPSPNQAAQTDGARASDPTVICQHVRTLAAADTTDEQVLDQLQRQCVQTLDSLESRYLTFAGCVEGATTSAAVVECEAALAKPPSLVAGASPTGQLEGMCDHVMGLLRAEIPNMGASVSTSEVETLRQRCITDAGATLKSLGPEAFNKQAACILAATDLKTLQACGSF
jgi:hypothetical protein